jgi:hypothetical protein
VLLQVLREAGYSHLYELVMHAAVQMQRNDYARFINYMQDGASTGLIPELEYWPEFPQDGNNSNSDSEPIKLRKQRDLTELMNTLPQVRPGSDLSCTW